MPRIRTIKPEILEDEKTAGLSNGAWRLFVSMITLSDDHGLLRANPKWLWSQAFWASPDCKKPDLVAEYLKELEECDDGPLIKLYSVNGQPYAQIINWKKHQRVDNASKSRCPGPDGADLAAVRGGSRRNSASRGEIPLDQRTKGPKDQRTPTKGPKEHIAQSHENHDSEPQDIFIEIPLIKKYGLYPITKKAVEIFKADYPGVDVEQELHKIRSWNENNPKKRKTKDGIGRHIVTWLNKAQDSSCNGSKQQKSFYRNQPQPEDYEIALGLKNEHND